jgi:soluble lytic murein transglycosylase
VKLRFGFAGLLLSGPVLFANTPPPYWLQAAPQDPVEVAIRDAIVKNGPMGPAATARALEAVAAGSPGTSLGGLAHFGAGLAFMDARQFADAAAALRQPDVARSPLADRAWLALGAAQESLVDYPSAAASYLRAADLAPSGATLCPALLGAAEALSKAGQHEKAAATFERVLTSCPGQEPKALERKAESLEAGRSLRAAAEAFDRLDRDYPASAEAIRSSARRLALAPLLPPESVESRRTREYRKANILFEASRYSEATTAYRSVLRMGLSAAETDAAHVRLGRALLAVGRPREAHLEFGLVKAGSPSEAEAAFYIARLRYQFTKSVEPYEVVVQRYPESPAAEDALLALANHYQKDAQDDGALPYYEKLLQLFPNGRYAERAAWRVAWAQYRRGHYEDAARLLERSAQAHASPWTTGGFLYWAGRSRLALGDTVRGRQILEEAVQRFKYTYHGLRAREALAKLAPAGAGASLRSLDPEGQYALPEPVASRVRALLLMNRFEAALEELDGAPAGPAKDATVGWIDWTLGRLRPAMNQMRRAYPEALGEGGDQLPDDVWRILFPLQYREALESRCQQEGVDAALVAALICQESTFDPSAVSRAGARGLMQVIPKTGLLLARSLRVPWRSQALFEPQTSLEFGVHYLRQMIDHFSGRTEMALAAYNAGPERVETWNSLRPDLSPEEFVESIPFTETRNYVVTILGAQEQYRRIYSFPGQASPPGGGTRASAH